MRFLIKDKSCLQYSSKKLFHYLYDNGTVASGTAISNLIHLSFKKEPLSQGPVHLLLKWQITCCLLPWYFLSAMHDIQTCPTRRTNKDQAQAHQWLQQIHGGLDKSNFTSNPKIYDSTNVFLHHLEEAVCNSSIAYKMSEGTS